MKIEASKPRNWVATQARLRRAGSHRKSEKSKRLDQKVALRQGRESGYLRPAL